MNRSIAFAATSLSAILLVAATLATPAEAAGRKIFIKEKLLLDTKLGAQVEQATPEQQNFLSQLGAQVEQATPKQQNFFSNTFPEGEQNSDTPNIQEAAKKTKIQPKAFTFNPKNDAQDDGEPTSLSFPEGEQKLDNPIQEASTQTPKAFTFDERDEAAATQIGNDDLTDEEFTPPPKKLKKQPKQQIADGIDEVAPPKKLKAPKKADAATSDDIDEEEVEDLATTKTKAKPAVEAAETDVEEEEEEAPAFKKKMRMHYSPSLRRYVETTDDDMGYDAAEFQDDSYEAPVYRQSYSRSYGHRDSYSSNYLPSCEN